MGRFTYHEVPDGEETELDNCSSSWDNSRNHKNAVGFPLHMSAAQSRSPLHGFHHETHGLGSENSPTHSNIHLQGGQFTTVTATTRRDDEHRNFDEIRLIHDHQLQQHDFNEFNNCNGNNKKRGHYWKHLYFLIVLLILQRYTPPPPPPNQSWTEFVARSTENCISTAQIVCDLAMYISYGCVQNMYRDLNHGFFSPQKDVNHHGKSCSIALPIANPFTDGNSNSTAHSSDHDYSKVLEDELTSKVAAQDLVIKNIVQNLKKWNDHEYTIKDVADRQPLSMMLTGPRGVGKYETAISIADILLQQCNSLGNTNAGTSPDRILTLQGMDFALDEVDTDNSGNFLQKRLVETILDHIYSHRGTGTVIVIKHIENISSKNKQELMHLIHQSKVIYTPNRLKKEAQNPVSQSWHMKNSLLGENSESDQVEINLGGSAILATSDIGTDKILKVLLKESKGEHDLVTYTAIEKAIDVEFQTYFDESVSGTYFVSYAHIPMYYYQRI